MNLTITSTWSGMFPLTTNFLFLMNVSWNHQTEQDGFTWSFSWLLNENWSSSEWIEIMNHFDHRPRRNHTTSCWRTETTGNCFVINTRKRSWIIAKVVTVHVSMTTGLNCIKLKLDADSRDGRRILSSSHDPCFISCSPSLSRNIIWGLVWIHLTDVVHKNNDLTFLHISELVNITQHFLLIINKMLPQPVSGDMWPEHHFHCMFTRDRISWSNSSLKAGRAKGCDSLKNSDSLHDRPS